MNFGLKQTLGPSFSIIIPVIKMIQGNYIGKPNKAFHEKHSQFHLIV